MSRYVITKVDGNTVTVEHWKNPADIRQITLPENLPQGWPEVVPGLQLILTVHRQRCDWLPAKKQIKDRFIPLGSTPAEVKP